jgi:uncharacterized protein YcbX
MNKTIIEQLIVYPIKALKGVAVNELTFTSFGVENDRRYMLINAQHKMITQRSHSVLSKFCLEQVAGGWKVMAPDHAEIVIYNEDSTDHLLETQVWKNPVQVQEKSKAVSQWFSEKLDEFVLLVEFQDVETRIKERNGVSGPLAFADGYPLLVCNVNSLKALNQRIGRQLGMDRFRPNIVVSLPVDSEYSHSKFEIATGKYIKLVEPCVRCNVPAIDQLTSAFDRELHETLKVELKRDDKTIFGMNAIATGLKVLSVGDEVEVHP